MYRGSSPSGAFVRGYIYSWSRPVNIQHLPVQAQNIALPISHPIILPAKRIRLMCCTDADALSDREKSKYDPQYPSPGGTLPSYPPSSPVSTRSGGTIRSALSSMGSSLSSMGTSLSNSLRSLSSIFSSDRSSGGSRAGYTPRRRGSRSSAGRTPPPHVSFASDTSLSSGV